MPPPKPQPKSKKKGKNLHGLYARNFPKDRRWAIDQDYADRLSPEERAWLADFNDRYYGGDFRGSDPDVWDAPARSVVNRDKHASAADALTLAGLQDGGVAEFREDHGGTADGKDWSPPPDYLESEEYREARDAFRSRLRQGRRDREPVASLPLERARQKLIRTIPPVTPKKEPTHGED